MISLKLQLLLLLIALIAQYGAVHAAPGEKESVEVDGIPDSDYQPPRIQKTTVSKSGRMMLEFGPAEGGPTWVAVRSTAKGAESEHIYSQKDGMYIDADISDDDRLIVVSWGSASYGEHLEVFERTKNGKYKKHKVDFTKRAWTLIKRAQKLHPSASAGHSYSRTLKLHAEPLAVVFAVSGDYFSDTLPQTRLEPMYFRYLVKTKKLELVP